MRKYILSVLLCLISANLPAAPVFWQDGSGRWPVWQSTDEFAVFTHRLRAPANALAATAKIQKRHAHVEIWRIPKNELASKNTLLPAQAWSPVFYEYENQGGRKMALAGGVIVSFKKSWSHASIQAWLSQQGLNAKPIHPKSYLYALDTPAGMAAMQTADELSRHDAVEYASPNWWFEAHPR